MAIPLLENARPARRLLADKAYDADSLQQWLAATTVEAVIPLLLHAQPHTLSTEKHIEGAMSSNGSSAGSSTSVVSPCGVPETFYRLHKFPPARLRHELVIMNADSG